MTDLDAPPSRTRAATGNRGRPGPWRVLSFVLVAAAALLVLIWVLQSRSASDVAVQNSLTLDIVAADVFVDGLTIPPDARVVVLGLDHRAGTPIGAAGVQVDVPSHIASLLALVDENSNIRGLALIRDEADRTPVRISATSTASALLALSPAMLEANPDYTDQRVEAITADPAFADLTDAITANANIGSGNAPVEAALAAILDRVTIRPLPDQGCDSILNARARTVAGTCAEPTSSGATIHNEQDRWSLVFVGPTPYERLCEAIAPAGTPGSKRTITTTDCGNEPLVAAPGPYTDRSSERAAEIDRVRVATMVDLYGGYLAPLLDLTGGQAGLNRSSNSHILGPIDDLVAAATDQVAADQGLASALDVLVQPATPLERHAATSAAARSFATVADRFLDDWKADTSSHAQLLDFYDRVGEQMLVVERTERRWSAEAWGIITIEASR